MFTCRQALGAQMHAVSHPHPGLVVPCISCSGSRFRVVDHATMLSCQAVSSIDRSSMQQMGLVSQWELQPGEGIPSTLEHEVQECGRCCQRRCLSDCIMCGEANVVR